MKSGEARLFAGILVVAIALSAIAIYPSLSKSAGNAPPPPPPKKVDISRSTLAPSWSHHEGDQNAPFTLVEFGDYECPTCAKADAIVHKLLDQYQGKLNLVFHHLKVTPQHQNSPALSMAVEAAALQGKFWPMHHAIYHSQSQFEGAAGPDVINRITNLAKELNLDVLRFRSELTGDAARKAAEQESELAQSLGIRQTPTFFFVPRQGKPTELELTGDQLKAWLAKPANWK